MKNIIREIRIVISTLLHVIGMFVWFVVFIGIFILSFNNLYDYYMGDSSDLLIGLIQFFSAAVSAFLLAAIFTSLGNFVSPKKNLTKGINYVQNQ